MRCDYPGCAAGAQYLNDGGFWCTHPHSPTTSSATTTDGSDS